MSASVSIVSLFWSNSTRTFPRSFTLPDPLPLGREARARKGEASKEDRVRVSRFERLTESAVMGNLGKRFAVLLPFTGSAGRISERDNRKDIDVVGNTEDRLHVVEPEKSNPVRSDSFRPRSQDH